MIASSTPRRWRRPPPAGGGAGARAGLGGGQEPQRGGARLSGDHRLDVARVAGVLVAIASVDGVVDGGVGFGELDVALDAASADVPLAPRLRSAVPGAVVAAKRPHVELVAGADDPDGHGLPGPAVGEQRLDCQLLRVTDAREFVAGPSGRGHGRTSTLIDSRSAIAR